MKIALVNLTKLSDFAEESSYSADIAFLNENNIDYVDYSSGRKDFDSLLNGFHEAISNPEIDIVWFIQGGTCLIKFISSIDWKLVEKTKKKYLGLSDYTHFSTEATRLGCTCFYGAPLVKITKYWKTHEERSYIVDFLKSGACTINATGIFQQLTKLI